MKIIIILLVLLTLFSVALAYPGSIISKNSCITSDLCLSIIIPVSSGLPHESYEIIVSTRVVLNDGDNVYEHHEINLPVGETVFRFATAEFKNMMFSFNEIIHCPGHGKSCVLLMPSSRCYMSYDSIPGSRKVTIIFPESGKYQCIF